MHPVIFLLVGLIQRNRSSDQRMFFRCQRASGEKMSEETFVFCLCASDICFKTNSGFFCLEQSRFETILSLHTRSCFLHHRPKTAFNFSRVSVDKRTAAFKMQSGKISSMVMSDRAANCVLGDKDGGKRDRSRNSLLVISFPSETPAGSEFLL